MAETSSVFTLVTPGPDITFNSGASDIYRITDIVGLDMAPLRAPVDDSPMTDGGIVHGAFYGARHFTVSGVMVDAATVTARNTMEDNLIAALESIRRASGTWSWTPTGGALRTLTVYCEIPVQFPPWQSGFPLHKAFMFGLVAVDPTW